MAPEKCHFSSQINRQKMFRKCCACQELHKTQTNRETQSTMERMQAIMTKKHDSNALRNKGQRHISTITSLPRFCTLANSKVHQILYLPSKCSHEYEQSHKNAKFIAPPSENARILRDFPKNCKYDPTMIRAFQRQIATHSVKKSHRWCACCVEKRNISRWG